MFRKKLSALFCSIAVMLAALVLPAQAVDPNDPIEVRLSAPAGVPVLARLEGSTTVIVAKSGTEPTHTAQIPRSDYILSAPAVTWAGKRYVTSMPEGANISKDASTVDILWSLAEGVQDLAVTDLTETEAKFAWSGGQGHDLELRRLEGDIPASTLSEGTPVTTRADGAKDSGLAPGTTYAYTLFQDGRVAFTLVLGTADSNAEISMAFVRDYSSTFLAETPSWEAGNDNLVIQWPAEVPLPLPGAGVVVPASTELPGGFVGTVLDISPNGMHVELAPGGFSDALAFLNLQSRDYPLDDDSDTPEDPIPPAREPGNPSDASRDALEKTPTKLPNTGQNDLLDCFEPGAGVSVDLKPEVTPTAYFKHKLDKYKWNFPTEIQLDTYIAFTVTARADISVNASGTCSPKGLDKVTKSFVIAGVPTMLLFEPTVEVKVEGSYTAQNVGLTATNGFSSKVRLGIDGPNMSVKRIHESTPLTPIHGGTGSVSFKLGGSLSFGPGVGNKDVGAVVGISGELTLLKADAKFSVTYPEQGMQPCATIGASAEGALKLSAKAWFTFLSAEASWDLLKGTYPLGGPWSLPKGCNDPGLSQDVLGPGVTKDTDATTGSSEQFGRVDGFVPGEKTWVLSTGRVKDAVGKPDFFASTELGLSGDDELSGLAGYPTHDAVSYTVNLIPTGTTLKVRYVFASEEYPEYVGSVYNDVMTISVNGERCAYVPGTTMPVSVNTINAQTNREYFVDNESGQSGYGTSMDGITVPLTCSVPVTPGKKTTVSIKLADTSDKIYDSAIALLDGGIWSE